ncbi:flavodoxin family protein [Eubacteriaceae bacterium ES3]|nr:flavodoxin family protein [Eubacteriaceae bacterium ES3]
MKTVLIHGQNHKGSTYHIARQLADKIGGESEEFFLPKDFEKFCIGCGNCFSKNEALCPHYEKLKPITDAMDEADVLIFGSPVYVMRVTGTMKLFLDHYGYRFMVHRPEEKMFKKQAVCVATAAGAGMKSTIKDMDISLFYWGIPKRYRLGFAVRAIEWQAVEQKLKNKIDERTTRLAQKIKAADGKVSPGLKTRALFGLSRMMQKKGFNEADRIYWEEKGWTGIKRPWK